MRRGPFSSRQRGFTLTELAVVMVVVSILLGGVLMTLNAQIDLRRTAETERALETAREALLGYAASQGRLPCPASDLGNGQEAPVGGSACLAALAGFLPALTLAIGPTDAQGFLLDGWGNRVRYSVTQANGNAFTTTNQLKILGYAALMPDLQVCNTSTGSTSSACAGGATLTNAASAIVYSLGKNGASPPAIGDEAENLDGDKVFISHTPSPTFDDIVIWVSPYTLYNRMIAAGAL